ncbi:hypothetical protein [Streptomyces glaucus]|uniref:Uncharacterized protein n=1 Tax=Streptomyces glaucus TaxID=284029 RepID=A0ABN3K4W0_9ACTN
MPKPRPAVPRRLVDEYETVSAAEAPDAPAGPAPRPGDTTAGPVPVPE